MAGSAAGEVLESQLPKSPDALAILVLGNDVLIEALPARPIQLANACGDLGFDLVLPLSWGDELIAEAALESLASRGPSPALLCSCPLVRRRLLQSGSELTDSMVSLVSPPLALARTLRATPGLNLRTLTFAGRCPDASAQEYDIAYTPGELFALLHEKAISLENQPDVFIDRVPADRSRFASLPGGCPAPDVLWRRCNERALVELQPSADLPIEVAQNLISLQPVLVDAGLAVGCACSGVTALTAETSARVAVSSLEPPRSTTPVYLKTIDISFAVPGESHSAGWTRPPLAVTPADALRSVARRK